MKTKAETSGDWQVTRRVPTAQPVSDALIRQLSELCDAEDGVRAVQGRDGARRLRVRYDASRTNYRRVQQWLSEQGVATRQGRWPRWLAAWYGMQDDNLRETSQLPEAACCNRPPRRH